MIARVENGQAGNAADAHDSGVELAGAEASPEARAAEAELGAALTELLLGLEPRDRAALLLAELDGYTASEIGAELGLSARRSYAGVGFGGVASAVVGHRWPVRRSR